MSGQVVVLERSRALDGVRAVSVLLVLAFHARLGWMPGGFVGVSVFFTLSGYLITSLLLAERAHTGRISPATFYARRARRLLPASLVCLVGVVVADAAGWLGLTRHVRRDVFAALAQVANWNFLIGDTSYAEMIDGAVGRLGPVDHFWSLAIEEQFYWVWPLAMVVLLRRGIRWSRVRSALTAAFAAAVVAAFTIARVWGAEAVYWSTPARSAEILAGAALAGFLADPAWRMRIQGARSAGPAGTVGLAIVVAAALTWPADGGPADDGWLAVLSVASVALIIGALAGGRLTRVLALTPFSHLGRISYGVYLYHWPIYAILDAQRVGLTGLGLLAVRLAVTLLIAEASFRLIEQPVRRGPVFERMAPWSIGALASVAVVTIVAVTAVVAPAEVSTVESSPVPGTFAPTTADLATPGTDAATPGHSTPGTSDQGSPTTELGTSPVVPSTSDPSAGGPVSGRVLLVGDSTAVALGGAFAEWATAQEGEVEFASIARIGCGLIRGATIVGDPEKEEEARAACDAVLDDSLPRILAATPPDVVVVLVTLPDVVERIWQRSEGELTPSDPVYVERLSADYRLFVEGCLTAGVDHVLWTVPVPPTKSWLRFVTNPIEEDDWSIMVAAIRSVAAETNGSSLLDLAAWSDAVDPGAGLRPDGLHFDAEAAERVVLEAYAPTILDLLAD